MNAPHTPILRRAGQRTALLVAVAALIVLPVRGAHADTRTDSLENQITEDVVGGSGQRIAEEGSVVNGTLGMGAVGRSTAPSGDVLWHGVHRPAIGRWDLADSDHDGMPNGWEALHHLDPYYSGDAYGDLDDDGVSNLTEYQQGTDPEDPESRLPAADAWALVILSALLAGCGLLRAHASPLGVRYRR